MASPVDIIKNILGTHSDSFSIGKSGPLLQRVVSTARLLLPPLLRFIPTSGAVAGDLATDSAGDVWVTKHNLSAVADPIGSNDNTQGYAVGSRWINTATGAVFMCVDASTGAAIWALLSMTVVPVFGTEYNYAESLGLSTTTSGTFQNKLTLNASLPAGTYHLEWCYGWGYSNTGTDFEGRIQVDASTIDEHVQEPKDRGSDQIHRVSGFHRVTFGSAGSRSFTIDYRAGSGGNQARIQSARLAVWRVS